MTRSPRLSAVPVNREAAAPRGSGLEVSSLTAGYGDLTVIWGVSFSLQPGTVTALLGRNGAGKTTLINAIGGLLGRSAGEIHLGGERIDGLAPDVRASRGLSVVPEGRRIFRTLTVRENLKVGTLNGRLSRAEARARLSAIYDQFPVLASRSSARAGLLSGGQQQMLAIAQAVVSRPACLLLDEPSAGLDPGITVAVFEHIAAIAADGTTILVAEQRVDAVRAIAARSIHLDHGRIVNTTASQSARTEAVQS
jgi:branched-chain amino acid transport system ATP-binding protein